jgi:hypothetical protein
LASFTASLLGDTAGAAARHTAAAARRVRMLRHASGARTPAVVFIRAGMVAVGGGGWWWWMGGGRAGEEWRVRRGARGDHNCVLW